MEPEFAITSERSGDERVIALVGELDMASAERFEQEVARAEGDPTDVVVLDLSGLTFLDSTGLRVIIEAGERLAGGSSDWAIVPGPERVQRVFELTGTAALLPFRTGA